MVTHIPTDKNSIREEREGRESLARALRALESTEATEKTILVDVIGSLKEPCEAGVPIELSGQMGKRLRAKAS